MTIPQEPLDPAPRARPTGGLQQAMREARSLALPFWRDPTQRRAWLLLASVIGLTLGSVWLNVQFSHWNNAFYDTLQNHDLPGFWHQLGVFGTLAVVFIIAAVYRQYLQQLLFMRWRTWLTQDLQARWLQPGTAYRMGARQGARIDNPDQRIADDAGGFVSATLGISLGLLNASVTLLSFVGILWGLSGTLTLPLGNGVSVPGYMVWVAIAYSLAGTWIAHRLGRPLVALNGQQQQVEADFRYALVQLRDHAEAVALARGERRERDRLSAVFEAVRSNWSALIRTTKRLTWFSAGYGQLANVFPLLAASPRYFAGQLQLGGLMQTAQAFGQVQGALSWFIDAYPRLADWRATVQRLTAFCAAADADQRLTEGNGILLQTHADDALEVLDLQLHAADGRVLLSGLRQRLDAGQRWLLNGPSGSGKSTLLRAVAGLASQGDGHIRLPARARMMFVPQRPYLPTGALRDALAYPDAPDRFSPDEMAQAMRRAGLAARVDELDDIRRWSATLSPGEQQRLHFARVLLHRPDWVFLDESTSALDEASERDLYVQLQRHCPATTVVSVGHRSTLRALHDKAWRVGPAQALAAAAEPAAPAPMNPRAAASIP
jgi:vitamin B12/bleomycin/antimicrobial peptide transport system ATP-binding/permease protein